MVLNGVPIHTNAERSATDEDQEEEGEYRTEAHQKALVIVAASDWKK